MKDYLNYQGDLSKLSKKDLEYLFLLLKDYQLQYKECLGIDEKISFGVEVEFEDILLYYVTKELKQYPKFRYWSCIPDKSCSYKIDDFVVGGEVVTPILHDIPIDWKMLSAAVEILKKLGANSTKRTSLHVHVGGQIFGEDIKNVVRFVKVWCIFEAVIFKFACGEDKDFRPNILYFAHPISEAVKLKCKYIPGFLENLLIPKGLGFDKKWAISFQNYYDLISEEEVNNMLEIRIANGTLKKEIIQNTIYFYLKLMLYVMSDKYDEALINSLFQKLRVKDFSKYSEIYAKEALMLADLIFDNTFDKINFLKQYVKKEETVFMR